MSVQLHVDTGHCQSRHARQVGGDPQIVDGDGAERAPAASLLGAGRAGLRQCEGRTQADRDERVAHGDLLTVGMLVLVRRH
jgi:hypothetical protein